MVKRAASLRAVSARVAQTRGVVARVVRQRNEDERHMARCLQLAAAMRGHTSPNPMVGCVIVNAVGRVVAEGVHRGPGQPHAEVDAIARLGRRRVQGGTLYVNLEPCTHVGRTPACAPSVAALGLARIVVGALDPIANHAGGAAWLRKQGLRVDVGVLAPACVALNRGFYTTALHGRPHVVAKAAASLDGKIATASGESKWITSAEARFDAMALRAGCDAILVGIETVLADDPKLTVRGIGGACNPVRIVVDSAARTPLRAALLPRQANDIVRVFIATVAAQLSEPAGQRRAAALTAAGATVLRLPSDRDGRVDLSALATVLTAHGILSVLIEGGGVVHGSFFAAGLVDELYLYQAPLLIGGDAAPGWLRGRG
nr:bifunctional diaminohydroxyphosphoribosylaminopyrimidine deaminase/5-amino-6-(5-phosphoribosylamino)uracil reductase RibD [Kofleriaceae bacterium]